MKLKVPRIIKLKLWPSSKKSMTLTMTNIIKAMLKNTLRETFLFEKVLKHSSEKEKKLQKIFLRTFLVYEFIITFKNLKT